MRNRMTIGLLAGLLLLTGNGAGTDLAELGRLPAGTELLQLRDEFTRHYSNGDGSFTAEISAGTTRARVTLYDPTGRALMRINANTEPTSTTTQSIPLDLSQLTAGCYLVRIETDSFSQTGKLLIQ